MLDIEIGGRGGLCGFVFSFPASSPFMVYPRLKKRANCKLVVGQIIGSGAQSRIMCRRRQARSWIPLTVG